MSNVVEFKKKAKPDDVDDYKPPSDDDLKGFIRILSFLRDLSDSETFEIDVTAADLNIKIQNHDLMDEEEGIRSSTCFTASIGVPFTPTDEKRLVDLLQEAFEGLDFGSVDADALSGLVDTLRSEIDDGQEDDEHDG